MNKKFLLIGMTVLLAAGLAWVGRAVYRARRNLVTIDVYNAPLAAVIKQLERQTRETILTGKGLEAKVTLAVKNLPLDEALDRLGQQVGANWSKWYAVHGSERALGQLEAALRDRTKIGEVGWTNIAPQDFTGGRDLPAAADGADTSSRQQTVDVDVQASGSGSNVIVKTGGPQHRIRMVTRSRDANGEMMEEIWCPEHVVLEQRLQPKLGDETYQDASEAVAREISEKVKGNLTTLYVLRKSPGGFPFAGRTMRQIHSGSVGGTNSVAGEPVPMPDIESAVKRAEAENYTRLTPEQRVQRAREKQAAKANP